MASYTIVSISYATFAMASFASHLTVRLSWLISSWLFWPTYRSHLTPFPTCNRISSLCFGVIGVAGINRLKTQ